MVEKSSNRFSGNCEKEFKCAVDTNENMNETITTQYKRDFMLQLRLHPLSLQKPSNLPDVEVVTEKLNLHNINDSTSKTEDNIPHMNNSFLSSKYEYFSAKHDYPLASSYHSRMLPYCYTHHLYNESYSTAAASKYRTAQAYCNPFKKTIANCSYLSNDFDVGECFVPKRCYPFPEDIWTCFPSSGPTNFNKKSNSLDVPRSRKKLSIIDPVTGKNILESATSIESYATSSETESFEPENRQINSTENGYEESYCDGGVEDELQARDEVCDADISCCISDDVVRSDVKDLSSETDFQIKKKAETSYAVYEASSENGINSDVKSIPCETNYPNQKTCEEKSKLFEAYSENMLFATAQEKDDPCTSFKVVMKASIDKSSNKIDVSPNIHENSSSQKLFCEQARKEIPNKVTNNKSDGLVTSLSCDNSNNCSHVCKESTPKQNDCTKEGIRQLKEKIYFLRQEQQKMAILQRFLHNKKYLLEETARNLDEKRIELSDWELNLYKKAKRLQEEELKYKQWLQHNSEAIYDKTMKLANREKILSGQEDLNSSIGSKQESFKRFTDYSREISMERTIGKSRNKETGYNAYSYLGNLTRIAHSNPTSLSASECKSLISSLDQIENNVVMMEKINAAKEIGDEYLDKSEPLPFNLISSKNGNGPVESSKNPLYSQGHVKY